MTFYDLVPGLPLLYFIVNPLPPQGKRLKSRVSLTRLYVPQQHNNQNAQEHCGDFPNQKLA